MIKLEHPQRGGDGAGKQERAHHLITALAVITIVPQSLPTRADQQPKDFHQSPERTIEPLKEEYMVAPAFTVHRQSAFRSWVPFRVTPTIFAEDTRTLRCIMLKSMRTTNSSEVSIKILLIGAAGQIGWELRNTLAPLGDIVATNRSILDLIDEDAIRRTVRSAHPDLIVNAAAYTQVDPAEAEPDLAMKVNGHAPGVMAQEARRAHAALVHYSTDYVFSGSIRRPYREDDEPNPLNTYGKTKLAGEKAIAAVDAPHLILRTSWVFGARGKNFFSTIVDLAREHEELKVVDDQIGKPNCSKAVAEATAEILARVSSRSRRSIVEGIAEASGTYHVCGEDHTSRFGFAEEIIALYGRRAAARGLPPLRVKRLIPVSSADFINPAARPHYSVLSSDKMTQTFGVTLPSWREQLALAFDEMLLGGSQ